MLSEIVDGYPVVGRVSAWIWPSMPVLRLTDMTDDTQTNAALIYCPACGYDLRGIPEYRCPECGFGFQRAAIADLARMSADANMACYTRARSAGVVGICLGVLALAARWPEVAPFAAVAFAAMVGGGCAWVIARGPRYVALLAPLLGCFALLAFAFWWLLRLPGALTTAYGLLVLLSAKSLHGHTEPSLPAERRRVLRQRRWQAWVLVGAAALISGLCWL